MIEKLKPCPFCGGKAEYQIFINPKNLCRVQCSVCKCATNGYDGDIEATLEENMKAQANIWKMRWGHEKG